MAKTIPTNDPSQNNLNRAEWEQWHVICARLLAINAVTTADLEAPWSADKTEGQRLLADLKFWGGLRARQGARS